MGNVPATIPQPTAIDVERLTRAAVSGAAIEVLREQTMQQWRWSAAYFDSVLECVRRDIDLAAHSSRTTECGKAVLHCNDMIRRADNVADELAIRKELNKLLNLYEPTPEQETAGLVPLVTVRERWDLGMATLRQTIEEAIESCVRKLRRPRSDASRRAVLQRVILTAFDDTLAAPGGNGKTA
jgi:hypothetical protein